MLENLYMSANRVDMGLLNKFDRRSSTEKVYTSRTHFSSLSKRKMLKYNNKLKTQEYQQYRYKNYEEIEGELNELAQKYPDYLKVTTAQELYKLPYPGGFCDGTQKKYWKNKNL